MTCMLDLFFLSHRSLKSYVSLSSIFFNCYLGCIISINLSSTSLILSSVISILLLRPSIEFFILVIILALLQSIYFFAESFIFPFVSEDSKAAGWNICITAALKSSSRQCRHGCHSSIGICCCLFPCQSRFFWVFIC